MRNVWITLAAIGTTVVGFFTSRGAEDDARPRKMMEEAFNHRYRWNENLRGLGHFTLSREGKTVKGSLRADVTKPHGGVEAVCDDEEARSWCRTR